MKIDNRTLGVMIKLGDALREVESCATDVLKSIRAKHDDERIFLNRVTRLDEALSELLNLDNAINGYEPDDELKKRRTP